MVFPESLAVSDLLITHPQYRAKTIEVLRAYYEGGDDFPKDQELRKKPIEMSADQCATPLRQARLNCAFYTNYFGDTISDLVSSICENGIEISASEGAPEYYRNLTTNANGAFSSAAAEARSAITSDFLLNRAFYIVKFPAGDGDKSLKAAEDGGEMNAQISALDPDCVTDWSVGAHGRLDYARTYEIELVRSSDAIAGPFDQEKHTWTYHTIGGTYIYTASKEVSDPPKDFDKDARAMKAKESGEHSFGACPVFKVDRKLKCAVGEKLLPTARQLFNEESDASFFKFTLITGGLFIKTNEPNKYTNGLTLTPFGAVLLGAEDSIERDKAEPAIFAALDAATAERRGQLGGLIHNAARQTATQSASGQNTSRATGAAIKAHVNPLNAFLKGFAEPHLATWRMMIQTIADARQNKDIGVIVSGLMTGADDVEVLDMDSEKAFSDLPYVPVEAKQARGKAVGLIVNANESEDVLNKIQNAADVEAPEPSEVSPTGE